MAIKSRRCNPQRIAAWCFRSDHGGGPGAGAVAAGQRQAHRFGQWGAETVRLGDPARVGTRVAAGGRGATAAVQKLRLNLAVCVIRLQRELRPGAERSGSARMAPRNSSRLTTGTANRSSRGSICSAAVSAAAWPRRCSWSATMPRGSGPRSKRFCPRPASSGTGGTR